MTARTSTASQFASLSVRAGLLNALFVDLSVQGLRRLPDTPVVVAHNHVSPLDQLVVASALVGAGRVEPTSVMRDTVSQIPLLGRMLASNPLVTAIDGPGHDEDAFAVSLAHLDAGRDLVVAPEHAVSTSLEVLPLRPSANRLAHAAGVPVVPVGIFGSHRLFSGTRFRPKLRVPIVVVAGNPIVQTGDTATDTRLLQLDLEALVQQAMDAYAGREEGERGAEWWPATRGGTAPLLAETMNVRDQAMADARSQQAPMWEPYRVSIPSAGEVARPGSPDAPGASDTTARACTDTATTPPVHAGDPTAKLDQAALSEVLAELGVDADAALRPWQPGADGFAGDRRRYPIIALPPHDMQRLHPAVWARMQRELRTEQGLTALVMFDHPGLPRQVFTDVSLRWEADTVLRLSTPTNELYITRVQLTEHPGRIDAVGVLASAWAANGSTVVRAGATVSMAASG